MSFAEFMSKPREIVHTETDSGLLKNSLDYRTISVSEYRLRQSYSPKSLLELRSLRTDATSKIDIPTFEKLCSNKKGFCVVIRGPTGSGKTTLVNVISKCLKLNLIHFNSSNVSSREAFMQSLNLLSIQGDPKSIVLISDLSEILKYTSEVYQHIIDIIKKENVKIVLEANSSIDKKYTELNKYSTELSLLPPKVTNKLRFIVEKETGVMLTPEQLEIIDTLVQDDFNQMYFAIMDIVTRINQLKVSIIPTPQDIDILFKHFTNNFNQKHIDYTIFELTKKALESTPNQNLVNYYSSTSVLPLMIHENYTLYAPDDGFDVIADYISDSDLMYSYTFKTSDEDFQSVFGMTAVSAPVELLDKSKKKGIKIESINFTYYLQKSANLSSRNGLYSETGLDIETVNSLVPILLNLHKTKQYTLFDRVIHSATESCILYEPTVCKMALLKLARIKVTKNIKQRLGLGVDLDV